MVFVLAITACQTENQLSEQGGNTGGTDSGIEDSGPSGDTNTQDTGGGDTDPENEDTDQPTQPASTCWLSGDGGWIPANVGADWDDSHRVAITVSMWDNTNLTLDQSLANTTYNSFLAYLGDGSVWVDGDGTGCTLDYVGALTPATVVDGDGNTVNYYAFLVWFAQ